MQVGKSHLPVIMVTTIIKHNRYIYGLLIYCIATDECGSSLGPGAFGWRRDTVQKAVVLTLFFPAPFSGVCFDNNIHTTIV